MIFFDEPTIGLDPVGARELRETVAGLRQAGKTILLTTHYMFEADELCQRVAVIAGGQIVAQGKPSELKAAVVDRTVIEIETYGVDERTLDRLRGLDGVASVSFETRDQAQVILVQAASGASLVQPLLGLLDGTTVGKVVSREPTLEDAYVELVREA